MQLKAHKKRCFKKGRKLDISVHTWPDSFFDFHD